MSNYNALQNIEYCNEHLKNLYSVTILRNHFIHKGSFLWHTYHILSHNVWRAYGVIIFHRHNKICIVVPMILKYRGTKLHRKSISQLLDIYYNTNNISMRRWSVNHRIKHFDLFTIQNDYLILYTFILYFIASCLVTLSFCNNQVAKFGCFFALCVQNLLYLHIVNLTIMQSRFCYLQ